MYTDTEAIVLRQTKTAYGRRMVVLLTKKYGKISAGTSISERGKNKSSLALRPFTYGRYELFKGRDSFSINGAEAIESFYSIGEDIDKFAAASVALELTDRLVEEDQSVPAMFSLLLDFLTMLEGRKNGYGTLLAAFRIKALDLFGSGIRADSCVRTGSEEDLKWLSVPEGGLVSDACMDAQSALNPLIFDVSDDIISIIRFVQRHPLKSLENLTMPASAGAKLTRILKAYYSYHLGIDKLKSESLTI